MLPAIIPNLPGGGGCGQGQRAGVPVSVRWNGSGGSGRGWFEGPFHLPCEPTRSTLHIIWSCGLFEGKGVCTSRVSPPAP
jgi:hypothetical protein